MAVPALEFYSHVNGLSDSSLVQLKAWSQRALPLCLENPGPASKDLGSLEIVEISIVSDEDIANIHEQFLDDPTATDVITFQHGELLVSFDTAGREAPFHKHSPLDELFLYVVHGFLHLNGHLDGASSDRDTMHEIQNRIWNTVLATG